MAISFYKNSGCLVISYGSKTKKSQIGEQKIITLLFQFAPFLKDNDNGLGKLYDWENNKTVFQFSLIEALQLIEKIEIALKTKKWDDVKVYHKYGDNSKSLNIAPYNGYYFIHMMSNNDKLSLGLSVTEFKTFMDYVKFASLNKLIVDGEYYFSEINKKNYDDKKKKKNVKKEEPEDEVNNILDDGLSDSNDFEF